jgi:hypothetical protein
MIISIRLLYNSFGRRHVMFRLSSFPRRSKKAEKNCGCNAGRHPSHNHAVFEKSSAVEVRIFVKSIGRAEFSSVLVVRSLERAGADTNVR